MPLGIQNRSLSISWRLVQEKRRRGAGGAGGQSALYQSLEAGDYWALDEASGTRASAFNSQTLTDNNTVGSATGQVYDLAADFVRANSEYLSRASEARLQAGDIDFWVAAWVRPDAVTNNMGIVTKDDGTSNREYRLDINSGSWRWFVFNSSNSVAGTVTSAATVSVWAFLLFGVNTATDIAFLSVNGGALTTAAMGSPGAVKTASFRIGLFDSDTFFFDGRIGPVYLGKNYVPTADDRSFLYNSGNGRTLAEVEAYSG